MRFIFSLLMLAAVAGGGWYAWENLDFIQKIFHERIESKEFATLEIRYSADEIMLRNEKELLKNSGYSYLEPKLMFYPYLLMNVKYSQNPSTTTEGILLWGLTDGEMVINTTNWDKTHGFEDCLLAKADKNDFKILKAIVEGGGAIDREQLYQKYKVDQDILDDWVDSCRKKKLVVISGNKFRLHFAKPRLELCPISNIDQSIVTQPARQSTRIPRSYSPAQIQQLAQIVFEGDFSIRRSEEVFLPVYSIAIQNPDGSTLTTYWNALNGKRVTDIPS